MAGFKDYVEKANSGARIPVMNLIGSNPQTAAALSKLTSAPDNYGFNDKGNKEITPNNIHDFRNISTKLAQEINDSRTILQILPDMELTAQILTSSVLSPKDMTTMELTYSSAEGLLPPEVAASVNAVIRKHFEQDYKIKALLPKMLRDIMFETGSFTAAVIPENSIDEAINGVREVSLEGFSDSINRDGSFKQLGILGPVAEVVANPAKIGISLESIHSNTDINSVRTAMELVGVAGPGVALETFTFITDNPNVLKTPLINDRIRSDKINRAIRSSALESLQPKSKMNDRQLASAVYKNNHFTYKPVVSIKTPNQLNRRAVGNPLVLYIPSEAVIPVYIPGNVEKQIGVFVLLDGDGNPISRANDMDQYSQMSNRLAGGGNFASAMLNKVKSSMDGFNINSRDHIDYASRLYGSLVEQDLLQRLKNGVNGKGVKVGKNDEIYRIMLARALAKQHTQLLYLPGELVTYMAFKFNDNGVGKSILEDMKILNSLRSMLLFGNVMASLKNSVGRTEVKLKLDESDPNPQKTIEIAQHEIMRSRQQTFPIGVNVPSEMIDYIQRSAYEFSYEGHPGLPDVGVEFGEKSSNYVKPDTDLDEMLRKQGIMAAGLNPETVDATYQAELATSVVSQNLLLAKRVMQTQDQFTPLVSDHMRKYIMHSSALISEVKEVLFNNFDKLNTELVIAANVVENMEALSEDNKEEIIIRFLNEYISSFEISLPKPNSITLENQLKSLEIYSQGLDVALDAIISDKFFTNTFAGDVANDVSTVKESIKAHYIRQFMADNGILPELGAITATNSEGEAGIDLFEIQKNHFAALSKSLTQFMVNLQPFKDENNKTLSDLNVEVSEEGSVQSSEPTESTDDGGGNDDFGGFDDIPGMDSDSKLDEEPTEDKPVVPEEEEPEETPKEDDSEKEKETPDAKDDEEKTE
jgi:hypothetical protein